jgi:hypothetical protein
MQKQRQVDARARATRWAYEQRLPLTTTLRSILCGYYQVEDENIRRQIRIVLAMCQILWARGHRLASVFSSIPLFPPLFALLVPLFPTPKRRQAKRAQAQAQAQAQATSQKRGPPFFLICEPRNLPCSTPSASSSSLSPRPSLTPTHADPIRIHHDHHQTSTPSSSISIATDSPLYFPDAQTHSRHQVAPKFSHASDTETPTLCFLFQPI